MEEEDDTFSVAATPQHSHSSFMACHAMTAPSRFRCGNDGWHDASSTQTGSTIAATKKTFLKLHRPDVTQRSLVDPDEVRRILSLQAGELLRRRCLLSEAAEEDSDGFANSSKMRDTLIHDGNDNDNNHDTAGCPPRYPQHYLKDDFETTSRFGILSEAGFSSLVSGVTTASRSTIVAGNNKSHRNQSLRRKHSPKSSPENRHTNLRRRPSERTPPFLKSVTEGEPEVTALSAEPSIQDEMDEDHILTANSMAGVPYLFSRLMNTHDQSSDKDSDARKLDERRSQYMSVLRLRMKANLGLFYMQRYLMMFPDGPTPGALSSSHSTGKRNPSSVPNLTKVDSSDVSSSSDDSDTHHGTYNSRTSDYVDYGNMPPAKPIKCSVSNENFLDLALTGSLGLLPHTNGRSKMHEKRAPGRLMQNPNQKSPDHYIVLINRRSGFPLAVCALKAASGFPVVRIYATRQRVFTQRPSATTQQLGLEWADLDDVPLYAWAELVSEGEFPDPMTFKMYMANGSEGRFATQPSYEATFDPAPPTQQGSPPTIQMKGRTDMERMLSGCALISVHADDASSASFHIDMSQGIDPALMICFTGIVDEIVEKSMRSQCKMQARKKIKNAKRRLDGSRA